MNREELKTFIRQKLREEGTTLPLGNKQPWTDMWAIVEPILDEKDDYIAILEQKLSFHKESEKGRDSGSAIGESAGKSLGSPEISPSAPPMSCVQKDGVTE